MDLEAIQDEFMREVSQINESHQEFTSMPTIISRDEAKRLALFKLTQKHFLTNEDPAQKPLRNSTKGIRKLRPKTSKKYGGIPNQKSHPLANPVITDPTLNTQLSNYNVIALNI